MNKLILYSTIAVLTAFTAATGFAKDKDDKKKDKDKDKESKEGVVYVERDGRRYYVDREGKRHWLEGGDRDYRRDYGDRGQDRTRTLYFIERNRPVERTVYVDSEGRYYRWEDGRRNYIRDGYYTSYPSKYYYPDGRRRVTITLPF